MGGLALCLALVAGGAARGEPACVDGRPARLLDARLPGFSDGNRRRLDALLASRGSAACAYDPARRPVAVFDWDNTIMRSDIGDALMAWLLAHGKILQPPARDWRLSNHRLDDDARRALGAACDALAAPGQPLPTASATGQVCAAELHAIYSTSRTRVGQAAFAGETTLTVHQPYAWLAQLLAGYRPAEVHAFALAAYLDAAATPPSRDLPEERFVRINPPMRDLLAALDRDGFDVWIVSASPQLVVETIAPFAGVAVDHVVGVRALVDGKSGLTTARLEGCGPFADGSDDIITFDEGKRCFINKVIFHRSPAAQLGREADATLRPALVGGDSDTDIAMLKDASELKLVIDRHKMQLSCNALANRGGRWLLQPMFILPEPPRREPYTCSHARDAAGALIVDEAGQPIADQRPRE